MTRGGDLLLLSGGMDSIALAYSMRPALALTIDYGQRCAVGEIRAAVAVASSLELKHEVVRIDTGQLGSGDLAGSAPLPEAPVSEWWPFRNQLLGTVGAIVALRDGCKRVVIGTVASDRAHVDGSRAFVESFDELVVRQEGSLRFIAPALNLTTMELIRESGVPSTLLGWAHSCHTSDVACGVCRGCLKQYQARVEIWGDELVGY